MATQSIDFSADDSGENMALYGLSSSLKPVYVGWRISACKELSINRLDDIQTCDNESFHSIFLIENEDQIPLCYLIKNQGDQKSFYKKYKSFDYLMLTFSDDNIGQNQIINTLLTLDCFTFAIEIPLPENREKQNFLQFA